ncbi:MAG TPA: carbohydrate binding domain-containing protein [Candidatus Omnitrophota bacterium]|nr:carbohydrate binding domain-containing protein [Candidatus Omnitrophota bacterium]
MPGLLKSASYGRGAFKRTAMAFTGKQFNAGYKFPTGLTFFRDFRQNNALYSGFSLGQNAPTFTRTNVACTYTDSVGKLHAVNVENIPRFVGGYYDATGFYKYSNPILLIEATSANLFLDGAFDDNSSWTDGVDADVLLYGATSRWTLGVDTANGGATTNTMSSDSLFGQSAQISITGAGIAANDVQFFNSNNLSLANATSYTVSFYIKTNVAKTIPFYIGESDDDYTVYNDLGTFTTVAGTWIRVIKTFSGLGGSDVTDARLFINFGNLDLYDINIESLQIEASLFATSFIPTTTGSLTRGSEVFTYPTNNNFLGYIQGTMVLASHFYALSNEQGSSYRNSLVVNIDGNNYWQFVFDTNANNKVNFQTVSASTITVTAGTSPISVRHGLYILVGSYFYNTHNKFFMNGSYNSQSNNNYLVPVGSPTYLVPGSALAKTVAFILFFNKRLPDTEIIRLSARLKI